MNYIKLKLDGKEWGAKLGLGYLRYLDTEAGIKIEELDEMLTGAKSLIAIPKLVYYSLKYNCKKSGESFNFTEDDIFDWIDEDGSVSSEALRLFMEAFRSSLTVDLGKSQPQTKGAKK